MKKKDKQTNNIVLFITRSYPPAVGGMERFSYNIVSYLKQNCELFTILNLWGKKFIPFFIPYAIMKSLLVARKVDVVYIGDSVLAIVGYFIKIIYNKPIVYNIHGLDILYPNKLYQTYLKVFFKYDKLICISKYTEALAKKAGHTKTCVLPLGINKKLFGKYKEKNNQERLLNKYKLPFNKHILLTVGRLVERKGVAWFIDKVMPDLSSDIIYIVVGQGNQKEEILKSIKKHSLEDRVFLLGQIEQIDLDNIYQIATIFVLPNIHIYGDAEGFGYVALEASAWGLPVITSGIEGIADAIKDDKNGFIINNSNPKEYVEKIMEIIKNEQLRQDIGQKAKRYTFDNYDWEVIIKRYYEELIKLIK